MQLVAITVVKLLFIFKGLSCKIHGPHTGAYNGDKEAGGESKKGESI